MDYAESKIEELMLRQVRHRPIPARVTALVKGFEPTVSPNGQP